jgi:hypothetical protein
MKKSILKYGIIAGAIVSIMLLIQFLDSAFVKSYGELIGYASMLIAFSTIVFAVHRHNQSNPDSKFSTRFMIGIKITLVASIIYTIAWMIISNTIGQDWMNEYYEQSIESIRQSGISQEEVDAKIAEMDAFREMYKNPFVKIGITFLEIFPVGLLVSLLTALLVRIKK